MASPDALLAPARLGGLPAGAAVACAGALASLVLACAAGASGRSLLTPQADPHDDRHQEANCACHAPLRRWLAGAALEAGALMVALTA